MSRFELERNGDHALTCRLEQDGGLTIFHDEIVAFAFEHGATVRLKAFLNEAGVKE